MPRNTRADFSPFPASSTAATLVSTEAGRLGVELTSVKASAASGQVSVGDVRRAAATAGALPAEQAPLDDAYPAHWRRDEAAPAMHETGDAGVDYPADWAR